MSLSTLVELQEQTKRVKDEEKDLSRKKGRRESNHSKSLEFLRSPLIHNI